MFRSATRRLPAGLVVAACLALPGAATAARSPLPISTQRCPQALSSTARCGIALVPLDPARFDRGRIPVWFARLPARRKPARGVLIPFAGGPGGALSSSLDAVSLLSRGVPDHDVLLVDARGTGRSGFLRCPALEGELRVGAALVAANARCARQIGRRRDFYTTAATVADVEAIRRRLGLGRPSLLGFSYGTFAATVYAVEHPHLVRAVALDGAFPLRDDAFARPVAAATSRVLQTICRRTARCDAGAAPAALTTLAARLRTTPAPLPGARQPLTETVLATILPGLLQGGDTSLVAAVEQAATGDTTELARRIAPQLAALPAGQREFSAALGQTVICNDYHFAYDVHGPIARRAAALRAAARRLGPDPFWPFSVDAWLGINQDHPAGCLRWPPPRTPSALRMPSGRRFPLLPVLVTNGDLDLQTPLSGAAAAAAQFPRAVLVTITNAPHVTLFSSACARRTIFRFLSDTRLPRPAVCAGQPVDLPAPGATS